MMMSRRNRKGKTVTCPWGCCGKGLTKAQAHRHTRHAEREQWRRQVKDDLDNIDWSKLH